MMILSNLPTETLLDIVGCLSTRDCRKLALTCRYLCEIARTSLFREITIGTSKDGRNKDRSEVPLEFMRFIIENPSVRRAIRVIRDAVDDGDSENVDTALNCDVEIMRDEAVTILDSLAMERARSGVNGAAFAESVDGLAQHAASVGMRNGVVLLGGFTGRLILLMHYLPHVTSLSLYSLCPSHTFFALAIQGRLSGGRPQGISSLAKIQVTRTPLSYTPLSDRPSHLGLPSLSSCNCADLLLALLALPSLRSLNVSGFRCEWDVTAEHLPGKTHSPNAIVLRASPLKSLILDTCYTTPSTLRYLSSIPRVLAEFGVPNFLQSNIRMEDSISDLLNNHAPTLNKLSVTERPSGGQWPPISYHLGSIVSFSALVDLTIDYRMLQSQLDRDARNSFAIHYILPPSLVILCMRLGPDAPSKLPEFMAKTSMPQYWAQEKTHFPSLGTFYIDSLAILDPIGVYREAEGFKACGLSLRMY